MRSPRITRERPTRLAATRQSPEVRLERTLLPLVGLACLLTPLALVALVCWWLVVAAEMPGTSHLRRLALGAFTVYAGNAAAFTLFAVLQQPCPPRLLLAGLLTTGLVWRLRSNRSPTVPLSCGADRWALGFGALAFSILWWPFVGASLGTTMTLISQTTDAANHAQLLVAINQEQGYLHVRHPVGIAQGSQDYPTAWHGNLWILSNLLLGAHPSIGAQVRLVALAGVTSYALLAGIAAAAVLALRSRSSPFRALPALGGLAGLASATLLGFGIFFVQMAAYTQTVAIGAIIVLALLAPDAATSPGRVLVVGVACAITVMQSWYLLAPVVGVAVVLLVVRARPSRPRLLLLGLVAAPPCLYPLLVGPSVAQVYEVGPTLLPTQLGVLSLLAATGAGCTLALRRSGGLSVAQALVAATAACFVTMAGLLALDAGQSPSRVAYYGSKVLLTTLLLGSVLASGLLLGALSRPARASKLPATVAAAGLALGSISTAWVAFPPRTLGYDAQVDASTLDAIFRDHPTGTAAGTESWVADGCARRSDLIATKWLVDMSLGWSTQLRADLDAYAVGQEGEVSMLLRRLEDPALDRMELYVHRECDREALARLSREPKVRVIRVP